MPHSDNQQHFPQLIKRLAGDGARIAESELALALLEAKKIIRSYVVAVVVAALSLVVMIVALAVLAQGVALMLTPYLGSAGYAFLGVGLMLALITFAMIFIANHWLLKKHAPVGLIFKWLMKTTDTD